MSSLPDLVRDNKLETGFAGNFTIHHYDDSDGEEHRRSNQRSEYWEDSKLLGRGGFGDVVLQRCVEGKRIHELRAVKKIAQSISQAKQFDYVSELETIAKFSHRRVSRWPLERVCDRVRETLIRPRLYNSIPSASSSSLDGTIPMTTYLSPWNTSPWVTSNNTCPKLGPWPRRMFVS